MGVPAAPAPLAAVLGGAGDGLLWATGQLPPSPAAVCSCCSSTLEAGEAPASWSCCSTSGLHPALREFARAWAAAWAAWPWGPGTDSHRAPHCAPPAPLPLRLLEPVRPGGPHLLRPGRGLQVSALRPACPAHDDLWTLSSWGWEGGDGRGEGVRLGASSLGFCGRQQLNPILLLLFFFN